MSRNAAEEWRVLMPNFKFGKSSSERRETLHPDLKKVVDLALKYATEDFSIVCGYRGEAAQEAAYEMGYSRAKFGESPHNKNPSEAVDLAPYPIDWDDADRFIKLSTTVFRAADELGVRLTWGGEFLSFRDYPHFELKT